MTPHRPANARPGAGRTRASLALCALVWALVLGPSLARWHEALHGHGSAPAVAALTVASTATTTASSVTAPSAEVAAVASERGFLQRLFSGHARADCWLLDQATLGYALPCTALSLPAVVLPQAAPWGTATGVAQRHVAHFQARGPPHATA